MINQLLAVLSILLYGVLCKDSELTIFVAPAASSCFYESAKTGDILETQYQVINAGQGDYEIGLVVYDPTGAIVLVDFKRGSEVHRTEVQTPGDYKICFDNSASHFSMKTIYFSISIENDDNDNVGKEFSLKDLMPEEKYEINVEEIQTAVKGVHERLGKAIHYQDQVKAHMARDRNIVEHNYERVNFYSIVSIIVMFVVGIIQIIMVRSLFDEKNRLHKIFKILS